MKEIVVIPASKSFNTEKYVLSDSSGEIISEIYLDDKNPAGLLYLEKAGVFIDKTKVDKLLRRFYLYYKHLIQTMDEIAKADKCTAIVLTQMLGIHYPKK